MKLIRALTFILGLAAVPIFADETPEAKAQAAAEQWLAIVDAGQYDKSWDNAAAVFKSAVTQEQWKSSVSSVRPSLGKVVSRKLKSATFSKSLPGAPEGQYVVIQFDTSFRQKKGAVETITPMLEADGQWKVSGYFIK